MPSLGFYRRITVALLGLCLIFAHGCTSPARISYIPDGGSYTESDLPDILDAAERGGLADMPSSEVADARQDALADLRTHGEDAAALADVLTHQFPVDVHAVPTEVHATTYDGQAAWVVIETWGEPGEPLSSVRLWVFSREDPTLIAALSR